MADLDATPDTDFDLVGALMDYEQGEADADDVLALFSHLVRTGTAYAMQGHYGRQANELISSGWLSATGEILRDPSDI